MACMALCHEIRVDKTQTCHWNSSKLRTIYFRAESRFFNFRNEFRKAYISHKGDSHIQKIKLEITSTDEMYNLCVNVCVRVRHDEIKTDWSMENNLTI